MNIQGKSDWACDRFNHSHVLSTSCFGTIWEKVGVCVDIQVCMYVQYSGQVQIWARVVGRISEMLTGGILNMSLIKKKES